MPILIAFCVTLFSIPALIAGFYGWIDRRRCEPMSENQPGPIQPSSTPELRADPDQDGLIQSDLANAPFQLSQEPQAGKDALKSSVDPSSFTAPAYEHLGELPRSYGTQSVYLVAYDPHQLFVYWDLAPQETIEKQFFVHVCQADGQIESRIKIQTSETGRYLPASRPLGSYYVELGLYTRNGDWQRVATSGRVTLPAEGLAEEGEAKFATLPFHLSFQRLMVLIENAMGTKEDLAAAVARLQRGERPMAPSLLGTLSYLSAEQLHTLELLLGQKFVLDEQNPIFSDTKHTLLRDRHDVLSSSGQGSEALSSVSGAFGSEGLFSGQSSADLSGGLNLHPLNSEALSSATEAVQGEVVSSLTISSGSGGLGGSEALMSLSTAFGSETVLARGSDSESLLSLLAGLGSESLSSFFALLAAGGSETLHSGMLAGPSSEAWRLAGRFPGGASDTISSEETARVRQTVEGNLEILSSLFSSGLASLDSLGSPEGGYSSENVAKKKSLW